MCWRSPAWIAGLGGAVVGVPAGPAVSLGLLSLGGLLIVLWTGRGRWAGLAPIAAGVALWAVADRPDVLIADNGRLFGIRDPGRADLSAPEGNGFVAESWLEDDGDLAGQAAAHARGGLERKRHRIEAEVPGLGRLVYVGSSDADGAEMECAAAAVLIAPNWDERPGGRVPLRRALAARARRSAGDPDHRPWPDRRGGAASRPALERHPGRRRRRARSGSGGSARDRRRTRAIAGKILI